MGWLWRSKYRIFVALFFVILIHCVLPTEDTCASENGTYQITCRKFSHFELLAAWWRATVIDVNWIIAAATIVVAVFTGTLWVSTYLLWREAKKSSVISEATMVAAHRPWLSLRILGRSPLLIGRSTVATGVQMIVKNIGESPAANIQPFGCFFTSEELKAAGSIESAFGEQNRDFAESAIKSHYGEFLFPEEESRALNLSIPRNTTESIDRLMLVVGVSYTFPFGEKTPHFTAKAFVITDDRTPEQKATVPELIYPTEYTLTEWQTTAD